MFCGFVASAFGRSSYILCCTTNYVYEPVMYLIVFRAVLCNTRTHEMSSLDFGILLITSYADAQRLLHEYKWHARIECIDTRTENNTISDLRHRYVGGRWRRVR